MLKMMGDNMNWEQQEQIMFNQFMALACPRVLWTATAGGLRTTWKQATAMKRMGLSKGVPDILVFESRGKYHGLCIELKKAKEQGHSYPSIEQKWWIEELNKRGYKAVVCYGFEEARETVEKYILKGE